MKVKKKVLRPHYLLIVLVRALEGEKAQVKGEKRERKRGKGEKEEEELGSLLWNSFCSLKLSALV